MHAIDGHDDKPKARLRPAAYDVRMVMSSTQVPVPAYGYRARQCCSSSASWSGSASDSRTG